MKELYNNVENTMNSISLNKFNKLYEDLTHEQTRILHKIFHDVFGDNLKSFILP